MFDLLYLRLGFCYLLSCAFWPLAMFGYWVYRIQPDMPRLHRMDFVTFAFHVLGMLVWSVGLVIFVFPYLHTLS